MDQGVCRLVAVEGHAARAAHQRIWHLRRHSLATLPHGIFAGGPIALVAPSLVVGRRSPCRKFPPCHFKVSARFVERRRGPARLLAWVGPGIEAAPPFPRVLVIRLAYTARDRADVHVTEIDVPAVLALGIAT